jgi:hypothetical protein
MSGCTPENSDLLWFHKVRILLLPQCERSVCDVAELYGLACDVRVPAPRHRGHLLHHARAWRSGLSTFLQYFFIFYETTVGICTKFFNARIQSWTTGSQVKKKAATFIGIGLNWSKAYNNLLASRHGIINVYVLTKNLLWISCNFMLETTIFLASVYS